MKAIILAAGMGKRLQEVAEGTPKSMIRINCKSILHRQIESCLQIGIKEFIFVLGYKKEMMKEHIKEILDKQNFKIIDNPIYDKTNTLYSLWLTRNEFDDDFIYFNADVLFDSELLKLIAFPSKHSQLLLEEKKSVEEEVKMIISKDNRILRIGKQLAIDKCAGEFIGIGKFNKEILADFADFLDQGVKNGQANNYFEYAVDLLAKKVFLEAVPTDHHKCIEIDFPEDLQLAKEIFSE